jgi:hypothetical protein
MREAFADGYAEHGIFPIPEWVKAACEAAVSIDGVSRAFVTEAGRAEGRRAALVNRRQRLYASHRATVMACAARLAASVHLDDLARILTDALSVTEATQQQRDAVKAAALAYLAHVMLTTDGLSQAWQQANADAVIEARAEGHAEASAAPSGGGPAVASAVARDFAAAAAGLATAQAWKTADEWTSQQLSGLAGDLAAAVGSTTDLAALLKPLAAALDDAVGVAYYLEEAMHAGYALGFAIYAQSANANTNYLVLDGNACPVCLSYAAGSPYDPDDVPQPPVHGGCRCWLELADVAIGVPVAA